MRVRNFRSLSISSAMGRKIVTLVKDVSRASTRHADAELDYCTSLHATRRRDYHIRWNYFDTLAPLAPNKLPLPKVPGRSDRFRSNDVQH